MYSYFDKISIISGKIDSTSTIILDKPRPEVIGTRLFLINIVAMDLGADNLYRGLPSGPTISLKINASTGTIVSVPFAV